MNNKTIIMLLLPIIIIALLVTAAGLLPFEKSMSETEQLLLEFIASDLQVKEMQGTRLTKYIKGPFDFSVKQVKARDDKVKQIDYNDKSLSLVVISDNAKMAIINGQVVKEGDNLNGMKVKKIEPERVLIKNKKPEWLYLEKAK